MKYYILYDGRAESGETDNASVLEAVGSTRREVKQALWNWKGHDGVLVEYDAIDGIDDEPDSLTNERIVGHLRQGKKLLGLCSFQ